MRHCCSKRRGCVCSVVPPHILLEIASYAQDSYHRQAAIGTLMAFQRLRGQRDLLANMQALVPPGAKNRSIYDAEQKEQLPGKLVRSEQDPPVKDDDVNQAYDFSGVTYDFLKEIFGRNSLDNRGMRLDSTTNFGHAYNNALWNGGQMVYGKGDGEIFTGFPKDPTVVAHEFFHGLTQNEFDLEYQNESGALNEHFSDVGGVMVNQWHLKQTVDQADWLIGGKVLGPTIKGIALRSMKAPGTAYNDPIIGKDPQPAHMKDFVKMHFDDGGVHVNSGIPNHAFYLLAMDLGGYSWQKAGQIWYLVAHKLGWAKMGFADFARTTWQAAGQLYGDGGNEQQAVARAWDAVGLKAV